MRRTALAAPLVALLLLAGCGGDSESSRPTIETSSGGAEASPDTTSAPDTTRAPGTTARPGTTVAPSGGLTEADLRPMRLTTADLPAGWVADPSNDRPDDGDDDDDGDAPACFKAIADEVGQSDVPNVEAEFAKGDFPALFQEIGYLGDEAAERFDAVVTGLDQCTDVTLPAGQQMLDGTIQPLQFPALGDDSAAYRMAFPFQGRTLTFDVSLVRTNGVVLVMLFGDLDGSAAGEFAPIARTAVAKVEDAFS